LVGLGSWLVAGFWVAHAFGRAAKNGEGKEDTPLEARDAGTHPEPDDPAASAGPREAAVPARYLCPTLMSLWQVGER
jgi:hypothetical protein